MAEVEFVHSGLSCPRFDYISDIKRRFEKSDPEKFNAFNKIFTDVALKMADEAPQSEADRGDWMLQLLRPKIANLFADEPELITGFEEFWKEGQERKGEMLEKPHMQFVQKVQARFKDNPEKMAAFNAPYNDMIKAMLTDPKSTGPLELWADAYPKSKAALEGEPDLLEEYEVWFADIVGQLTAIKAAADKEAESKKKEEADIKTAVEVS